MSFDIGCTSTDSSPRRGPSAASATPTIYEQHEVDIDYDEELGVGSRGVLYEARLRPSDELVVAKILHAHYRFEVVRDLFSEFLSSVELFSQSTREHIVVPKGLMKLNFGQKQTVLILPRAISTLERELKRRIGSIVPALSAVHDVGEVIRELCVIAASAPNKRFLPHREVKPCDILFLPNRSPSVEEARSVEPRLDTRRAAWFPMLPLPCNFKGTSDSGRYTDPTLGGDEYADKDADMYSLGVMLWECIERRDAPSHFGEMGMPTNSCVPRELKMCVSLAIAGRKDQRPSIDAVLTELEFACSAMAQREKEDAQYRERKAQQDQLQHRVLGVLRTAVEGIQTAYAEATRSRIGYAVQTEVMMCDGFLKVAVGASGESIDLQFRSGKLHVPNAATLEPAPTSLAALPYEPPLGVYESTIEHDDPGLKVSPAFVEVANEVETVDLSDGHPKTSYSSLRISNYRHLACTPTLEYADCSVDGFLCGMKHLRQIDLTPLQVHVRKVGDFFLYGCSNLVHISLQPLQEVTAIGFAFLGECTGLRDIDLKPFSHVQSVGGNFMHHCIGLEEIDLTPFVNVLDLGVPSKLLQGCTGLRRVILPRNLTIDMVRVHEGKWVEENEKWWEWTSGVRVYFIPRLEPRVESWTWGQ